MAVTLGVDTAGVNGRVIDAGQAKAAGAGFAIHKASEGTTFVDPLYPANRRASHGAGLLVGQYHFLSPGNGARQADFFVRIVNAEGGFNGTLTCLDFESSLNGGHPSLQDFKDFVSEFRKLEPQYCAVIEALVGHAPPISYANIGAWGLIGNPSETMGTELWWPSYVPGSGDAWHILQGVTLGPNPYYGKTGGWDHYLFRQYSSSATIAGLPRCDVSVFPGTIAELARHAGIAAGPIPIPTPHPQPTPSPHPQPQPSSSWELTQVHDVNLRGATNPKGPFVGGPGVRPLQRLLGVKVDGAGGPSTRASLGAFQHGHGLTMDFVAGPKTFTTLVELS